MASLVPSSSSMGSTPRNSINTDTALSQVDIEQYYTVQQQLGAGAYAKCVLAECKRTQQQVVLKLVEKRNTKMKDFLQELNLSIFLSAHPHVIDAYNVAFETQDHFTFSLEYAPLGDLFEFIQPNRGLPESSVKLVVKQVSSALEFMHSQQLCHRDLKPENVAVFEPDLSIVKLADFGMARRSGTLMRKAGQCIPYTPPEIAQAARNENYRASTGTDVWSLAVLMFCCLTGSFPWQSARESDSNYFEFAQWQRRKSLRVPASFREFTPRLQKLLRRMLEPRPHKRASVLEIRKFLKDDWTVLIGGRRPRLPPAAPAAAASGTSAAAAAVAATAAVPAVAAVAAAGEANAELLASMLERFGVNTKVTKRAKEQRVQDWVASSSPDSEQQQQQQQLRLLTSS